jgi:hypothetical protein
MAAMMLLGWLGIGGPAIPFVWAKDSDKLPSISLDGPHLLKASQRSALLRVADFNSDGLADIVTVANDRSVLELHLQETRKTDSRPAFRRIEVVVDQFVQGLAALDVDGDGRTDVLTAGAPARLAWLRQGEDGVLSSPQPLGIEAEDLVAADFNGDGVPDLICVNGRRIDLVAAGKKGLDWTGRRTHWSAYDIQGAPEVVDVDGDSLADLVFVESKSNDRILVRFQTPEGGFPDEAVVPTSGLSRLAAVRKTAGRQTLVGLLTKTEILEQTQWTVKEKQPPAAMAAEGSLGRTRTVAFDPELRSDRLVAGWAPLAKGGIPCLLVGGPSLPSLRLLRSGRDGALHMRSVPSLTGIVQLLPVPPVKKGGAWSVGLVSRAEKTLAFGELDAKGETLSFPQPLALGGAPLAAAIGNLGRGKNPDLAVVRSGEGGNLVVEVHYDLNPASGTDAEATTFTLKGQVGDAPSDLLAVDLNRDGKTDLVVLFDYADPAILLQTAQGTWEPLELAEGMLQGLLTGVRGGAARAAVVTPKGGESLLIAKENYARAVHLGPDNQVVVDGQFNGKNARSRLRAALVAALTEDGAPHVVLLDSANRCLTVYKHNAKSGDFDPARHVDIEEADFQALLAVDLNEDRCEDIVLLAPDRMTVIYSGMAEGRLETIATARTDVDDGGYGLVATAEILGNKEQQILAVERTENVLECFLARPVSGELRRFYRFKVFDSDARRSRRDAALVQVQPRELQAADLNGDDKPDLILLMHDKIGIYYQK